MKKVDIVPILDNFTDMFDVEPGGIHCVSKDCSVIKMYEGDNYMGSLGKNSEGWNYSPASRAHSLNLNKVSEIKSILVFLDTNF